MSGKSMDQIIAGTLNGDLSVVFKPVDLQLHGHHSRESIALNTPNRRGRRIGLGILEVVVESPGESVDWRLKLNGISVTKEFKPHYSIRYRDRMISKFIYDVTSLLNTEDSMGKDWVNLTVRYEGGSPIKVRKIQLTTVYEDPCATTSLRYWTGLLLLGPGDSYSLRASGITGRLELRVSTLSLQRPSRLLALVNGVGHELHGSIIDGFEEHVVENISGTGDAEVTLVNKSNDTGQLIASSLILYSLVMKKPVLDVEVAGVKQSGDKWSIQLRLSNRGEAQPDSVACTVLYKGSVLASCKLETPIEPGDMVEKELIIPGVVKAGDSVSVRVAWSKLSKTWFIEKQVWIS